MQTCPFPDRAPVRSLLWPILTTVLILFLAVCLLRYQGRLWWCACGHWQLWSGDVRTSHNSQHFVDPYTFTHVLHGVVLFWLLAWTSIWFTWIWRLVLAISLEAAWEVFENTEFVIQRYRDATLALGYTGDTIANSMGDIIFCAVGFAAAWSLGIRRSVLVFLLLDILLLWLIRDSLVLNILMLIWPIDAIKEWQLGY